MKDRDYYKYLRFKRQSDYRESNAPITTNIFTNAHTSILLAFILFFTYLIQIFIIPPQILDLLITHPSHLFSLNFFSVFTAVFLHGDLIHLLSNIIALIIFGKYVEQEFQKKTILIFIASGVIANLISHIISLATGDIFPSLGASGGVAGLIIFATLMNPLSFIRIFVIPIPVFALGWFLISLDIIGLTNPSNINHYAHIGGYLALLIMFFFLEIRHKSKIITGFIINLVLLSLLFLAYQFLNLKELLI